MKYGKLTFIEVCGKTHDKHLLWRCICDCGNEYIGKSTRIRMGRASQCELCSRKQGAEKIAKHGMKGSMEYSSWQSMKSRCLNKTDKDYYRYGEKGIDIYDEWIHSFEKFYEHMGPRKKGESIDRIDNTKGYFPGNVRWANHSQQQKNKSSSYIYSIKGKEFDSMTSAAEYFSVSKPTIGKWVNGWIDHRINKKWEKRDDCSRIKKY